MTHSAEEKATSMKVTPFEKNLEVWRQLWRVVERSDLVCQLVDARNPTFYYSTDLEAYAAELVPPKPMVGVVNKADYLSRAQQREWARHFEKRGVTVLFFSARQQQEQLNKEAREERDLAEGGFAAGGADAPAPTKGYDSEDDEDFDTDTEEEEEEEEEGEASEDGGGREEGSSAGAEEEDAGPSGSAVAGGGGRGTGSGTNNTGSGLPRMLNRLEMCVELERLARTLGVPDPSRNGGRACVGMVGYPNVGKSSLINVLVGATPLSHGGVRVSVGATPGKTKHFQTLVLSNSLMLCDCPGLVFPSFVSR